MPSFLDPFAEADEDTGETKQSQNYIHIRIQRMFSVAYYACRLLVAFGAVMFARFLSSREYMTDRFV